MVTPQPEQIWPLRPLASVSPSGDDAVSLSEWLLARIVELGTGNAWNSAVGSPAAALPAALQLVIGIGAQKAGTTSLGANFKRHRCVMGVKRVSSEMQYWDRCLYAPDKELRSTRTTPCSAVEYVRMLQKGNILHSRQSAEAVASRRGSAVHFSAENATLQAVLASKAASGCARRAVLFEKTPSYFPTPGVALALRLRMPQPSALRFVLVLRDPAERTYSNFLMFRAELFHDNDTMEVAVEKRLRAIRRLLPAGSAPPSLAFDNSSDAYGRLWQAVGAEMYALADPSGRWRKRNKRPEMWLHRGAIVLKSVYVWQMREWLRHFSGTQFFVADSAVLRSTQGAVLAALYGWLGIGGSYARLVYTGDLPRFGSQGGLKHGAMAAPTRRRLQAFFAPYDRALLELLRRECRDPMGTRFSWIDRWRDEGCAGRVCTTHG